MAKYLYLHNKETVPANGSEFIIGDYKSITLEISGTSTSRTLVFEACGPLGVWYPIMGVKPSDYTYTTQTTENNELRQFDVTGLVKFRVRAQAVAGGNVTVTAKAVE